MSDLESEATPALEHGGPSSVRRGGIQVGDFTHALVSLTCAFDSVPRRNWSDVLGSARALGFRMIDVVVVWERHEFEPGVFDFGHDDPQLDLAEFLRLAKAEGLFVCVRPGPRQPALWGLSHAGLARDIAATYEPTTGRARSSVMSDGPFSPTPSLADGEYLNRAELWLEQVGEQVRPFRHPRGPVVGAHLECASSLLPYETVNGDTHPAAVAAFRAFVKGRYERPSILRVAYDNPALDFTALNPPNPTRAHDDAKLLPQLDWARCQLQLASAALDRFAAALSRTCPGLPTSVPEFESRTKLKLRLFDIDVHGQSEGRRWSAPPGQLIADAPIGRLPLVDVPLTGGGDEPFRVLTMLAGGSRGVCLTPGCEAPGLLTTLLAASGDATDAMSRLAPLLQAVERTQLHALRLEACVHIVVSDQLLHLDRLSKASETGTWLQQASVFEPDRPLLLPSQISELQLVSRMLGWLETALVRRGVPYRYCSENEIDNVVGFAPWVVLPTITETDPALVETIRFAERRGLPFSIGPRLPAGVEHSGGRGSWPLLLADTERTLVDQVDALLAQGDLPRREISSAHARVLFHVRPEEGDDALAVAFVLNPTGSALDVSIACPGYEARDAFTQASVASFAERLSLSVPAESIRMLELLRRDAR